MQNITRTKVNMCTTFAATGNPNGAYLQVAGVDNWTTANKEDGASETGYKCLKFGGDLFEVIDLPETKRIAVWDAMEFDALGHKGL